jgi:hypothetical protein
MSVTVDQKVKDIFEKNTSISMNVGATIDINLNTLIDWDKVTTPVTGNADAVINNTTPFKKLFPIDTVIKPNRPVLAGVRYAISGDIAGGSFKNPTTTPYQLNYRTYYASKDSYYKYWVSPKDTNANLTISYPKTIPVNKVVVKFETSHATPSSWTISANSGTVLKTGTAVRPFTTTVGSTTTKNYDAGTVTIYYTGTTWSLLESDLNYNAFVNVTSLNLTAVNPGGWIGVIEVAPHMVKDLSNDIVSFDIVKEQNSSTEELLPVGYCTANSLDLNIVRYDKTSLQFKGFNKYNISETIDTSKVYLVKNAEVTPFVKVYHADGTSSDARGTYFKVPQGVFYIDKWDISDIGDVNIFALDAAKILQESVCPDMVCENYSAIAIIRRMLDAVGFTNYNFNYTSTDSSVIVPAYWWSSSSNSGGNGSVTVWDNIQDLCRDSQMTALVDEYNVLQFYTRDYLFDSTKDSSWQFRHTASGALLPNIISLSKKEMPSINQINIRYKTVSMASYDKSSHEILEYTDDQIMAAAMLSDILITADPEITPNVAHSNHYMGLKIVEVGDEADSALHPNTNIFVPFNGYVLIDAEIIEYDAIEYLYQDSVTHTIKYVDVSSKSDLSRYLGLAEVITTPNVTTYKTTMAPTNRYRIKTRGAFGTKKENHYADPKTEAAGWIPLKAVIWK